MFTGIIEAVGKVTSVRPDGDNIHFSLSCPFTSELIPGQSLSHNGVCLTVTEIAGETYYNVTAVAETLVRSNLGNLQPGDEVNLERCMTANGRFDGHIVQGHVDAMAECISKSESEGSIKYTFRHEKREGFLTVGKGSVCVNGVSLTVVDSETDAFSVVIIPYTLEHTNLKYIKPGSKVNVEFDIVGKYLEKMFRISRPS